MADEKKKKLQRLKYTLSELAALSRIATSSDFAILRRIVFRYIRNLRDISYKLPEDNPQYLAKRHAELVGMGLGARQVIMILEASSSKLDEQEDEFSALKEDKEDNE